MVKNRFAFIAIDHKPAAGSHAMIQTHKHLLGQSEGNVVLSRIAVDEVFHGVRNRIGMA
jgi:hypothetical protein